MSGLLEYDFGERQDKTKKGLGYFGLLKRPDGDVSTELSAGFDFGNGEVQAPLLIPTLTNNEINSLLTGNKPNNEIIRKAQEFAKLRINAGLSPFASQGEQQQRHGLETMPYEQWKAMQVFR